MTPIQRAVQVYGSQSALADAIGVSKVFVSLMVNKRRKVPAGLCMLIEAKTGGKVSAVELRPDIFKPPVTDRVAAG